MRISQHVFLMWLTGAALFGAADEGLHGTVQDSSGASVPAATVSLELLSSGAKWSTHSGPEGGFSFPRAAPGAYRLAVQAEGLSRWERRISVPATPVQVLLQPAQHSEQVVVQAREITATEEIRMRLPGSVDVVDAATLTSSRVFNFDEALRKVPGVYVRGEEGFALRPNVGIRGLSPTRSAKVLLLEDGIPLSYAPYGDNASYYHPPIERFEAVEVVKGAGQILYGPSTVGGVINYVTPAPPDRTTGEVVLTGGNLDYLNGRIKMGTRVGSTGVLADFMRKQGDGARENTHFGTSDGTVKVLRSITPRHSVSLKANYYGEDSQLTYSGLRLAEFQANPRANPFRNDALEFDRYGASATHSFVMTPALILTTNLYGSRFARDWWRQSSNSAQRPNDASDPACGGMANLYTTCGIEGRLRRYTTWGVEPRARWSARPFEADFGFRAHFEAQDRRQLNGPLPSSRDGVLVESNERRNQAYSGFLQPRLTWGGWAISPGLRVEKVRFERVNRLLGVRGATNLTQLIPGIGASYTRSRVTFFAGVHRGFAPPRTEDVINNTTGGTVDLDPELSWNYEVGMRARVQRWLSFEGTFFRLSFENQIIPASLAGGVGTALTNGGRTLHQGGEVSARTEWRSIARSRHSFWLRSAWTWLPWAQFTGTRYSSLAGFAGTRITGNRVPYAPEHLLTSSAGYTHSTGLNAMIESVYTGSQFGDDLNTVNVTPDGQRGVLPGFTVWNATVNYPIEQARTTLFFTTKNAFDRLFVVDRARGILPGMPRLLQVGLRFQLR